MGWQAKLPAFPQDFFVVYGYATVGNLLFAVTLSHFCFVKTETGAKDVSI
ncbi:hypothetical protein [Ruegeria arenilitoris]|nr:hypothetical protein [Ruegeria arenilitoris]